MVWKITFTTLGDLPFITHVRNCVMGATQIAVFTFKYDAVRDR